jgi:hypothetical protein
MYAQREIAVIQTFEVCSKLMQQAQQAQQSKQRPGMGERGDWWLAELQYWQSIERLQRATATFVEEAPPLLAQLRKIKRWRLQVTNAVLEKYKGRQQELWASVSAAGSKPLALAAAVAKVEGRAVHSGNWQRKGQGGGAGAAADDAEGEGEAEQAPVAVFEIGTDSDAESEEDKDEDMDDDELLAEMMGMMAGDDEEEEQGEEEQAVQAGQVEPVEQVGQVDGKQAAKEEPKKRGRKKSKHEIAIAAQVTDAVNAAKAHAQKAARSLEAGFFGLCSPLDEGAVRAHASVAGLVAMEGPMLMHIEDERTMGLRELGRVGEAVMGGVGIHMTRSTSPSQVKPPAATLDRVSSPGGALDGDVTADLDTTGSSEASTYRPVWLTLTGDMFLHATGPPQPHSTDVLWEANGIDASSEVLFVMDMSKARVRVINTPPQPSDGADGAAGPVECFIEDLSPVGQRMATLGYAADTESHIQRKSWFKSKVRIKAPPLPAPRHIVATPQKATGDDGAAALLQRWVDAIQDPVEAYHAMVATDTTNRRVGAADDGADELLGGEDEFNEEDFGDAEM